MGTPVAKNSSHQKVNQKMVEEANMTMKKKKKKKRKSSAPSSIALITSLIIMQYYQVDLISCQPLETSGNLEDRTSLEGAPAWQTLAHLAAKARRQASAMDGNARVLHELGEEAGQRPPSTSGLIEQPVSTNQLPTGGGPIFDDEKPKLRIVRLLAPEAVQNGTQNVTIDCMFKFDKKLDQRLTVKWFFNDELEPIYQWIPELNKRVYSDKYEHFLDKSYELTEDVDFMLEAYRWLLASGDSKLQSSLNLTAATATEPHQAEGELEELARRRLLAGRINKLAKLGGRHSRQLLHSLRAALQLDHPDSSRFRALRLLQPTTELSGRFTCSVSSLDGDDLRSTRLLVYEPAKALSFNVTRISHHQYNLTCSALGLYPRPQLHLARYRAELTTRTSPSLSKQISATNRPKLAATSLRQEPLIGAQTQLVVRPAGRGSNDQLDLTATGDNYNFNSNSNELQATVDGGDGSSYDIHSWALVDDATLSSNVVTQFECLLAIEGAPYERRQSLALQRGWHVNANNQNQNQRQALVGLFSALASLLCLILALISSLLIFRLLKRHARNRIHHQDKTDSGGVGGGGGSRDHLSADSSQSTPTGSPNSNPNSSSPQTLTNLAPEVSTTKHESTSNEEPEGVYRIPENSSFSSSGTRFIIGPSGGGHRTTQYLCASSQANYANLTAKSNGNGENMQLPGNKQPTYGLLSACKPLYC